jgi:two-component system response regulator FixJ
LSPAELQNTLTPREHAVLTLIIQGSTSKAAGDALGISPRTIEFHRANIMQKLSAKNVADLMRIVFEQQSAP